MQNKNPFSDDTINYKSDPTLLWEDELSHFSGEIILNSPDEMKLQVEENFLKMVNLDQGTPLPPQIVDLPELPKIDDLFEFRECIGSGGFCQVHKAFDLILQRLVAIMTLSDHFDKKFSDRNAFIAEAKVTASLNHPNIIPTHGLYTDSQNRLHLVEKLVEGKTFGELIHQNITSYRSMTRKEIFKEERGNLASRIEIFFKVCDALEYAHNKKILHRDIKPENIMIGQFNEVYVIDWGIAESRDVKTLPKKKYVPGTLSCLAPEILSNSPYDSRSDIYSLGVLLFYLVYLKKPFPSKVEPKDLIKIKSQGRIVSMKHAFGVRIPLAMEEIIRKAMAVQPAARYQSVQALADDLRRLLRDNSIFESVFEHVRKVFGVLFRF